MHVTITVMQLSVTWRFKTGHRLAPQNRPVVWVFIVIVSSRLGKPSLLSA
jgi:hypothetical protein